MVTPTSTGWRFFRACVFAVLATQLAALGHLLGGGQLPDPAILLTVTVFLGGSLSGLATQRRSGWQIFAVMVASQLIFHAAFQLTAHACRARAGLARRAAGCWCSTCSRRSLTSALMAGGESTLFRLFAALHRVLVPAADPPGRPAGPGLDRGHHRRPRRLAAWQIRLAGAVSRSGPAGSRPDVPAVPSQPRHAVVARRAARAHSWNPASLEGSS